MRDSVSQTGIITQDGWSEYYPDAPTTLYRQGRMVYMEGVLTPGTSIRLATIEVEVGTVPEGYRPIKDVRRICQASSINRFLLNVHADGRITFSRLGSTTYINTDPGDWMTFGACWVCA